MTSIVKKRLLNFLFSISSGFIIIYFVVLHGLSLHKEVDRATLGYNLANTTIQDLIVGIEDKEDVDDLIKFSCDYTCKQLSFHRKNELNKRKANCIGYAQYTSEVLNKVFRLKGLSLKAHPVVGRVYLYGVNLHPVLLSILPESQSNFFKDHDFVEIGFEDGSIRYVDTSLQDLTGKLISSEPKISVSVD